MTIISIVAINDRNSYDDDDVIFIPSVIETKRDFLLYRDQETTINILVHSNYLKLMMVTPSNT